jgi:hypothetical protein
MKIEVTLLSLWLRSGKLSRTSRNISGGESKRASKRPLKIYWKVVLTVELLSTLGAVKQIIENDTQIFKR